MSSLLWSIAEILAQLLILNKREILISVGFCVDFFLPLVVFDAI